MSDGQTIILRPYTIRRAHDLIDRAPDGAILNVKLPRRTVDQNAKMWALLSEISRAKPEGRTLTPDVWKALFLHALDHSIRFEPALDGNGMVPVGFRTSRMSKAQMGDLLEFIAAWGAQHGVQFGE